MPEKGKTNNMKEKDNHSDNRHKGKDHDHNQKNRKDKRDDSKDRKDKRDDSKDRKDKRDNSKDRKDKRDGSREKKNKRDNSRDRKGNSDDSNDKSDGNEDKKDDGRKKQKEYFKEELRRLEENLDKEASKIVEPEKKEFTPDIFNKLEPYYNTDTPRYLIELPEQVRHGYVSRQTAIGLCDPWVDLEMDVELLPRIESKVPKEEKEKKKSKGTPRSKEGSTHLPKFPHVCVPTDDLTKNKKIYYSEVPALREELRKKYSSEADDRIESEYQRTKQDFYRMELDKMDEYHPSSKPKMKATYFAYLQNNPGAKKAVHECVKETEEKEEKEKKEKDERKKKEKDDNKDRRSVESTPRSTRSSARNSARSERSQHAK